MQNSHLITLTAYAERCGVDKSVISRQVKAGQIPVVHLPDRKWPMIDPAAADAARAKNIDSAKAHRHIGDNAGQPLLTGSPAAAAIAAANAPPVAGAANGMLTPQQADQSPAPHFAENEQAARAKDSGLDYTKARTLLVGLNARERQLELAKKEKSLVLAADVESARQEAGALVLDRLLSALDDAAEALLQYKTRHEMAVALRSVAVKALNGICDELENMASDIEAMNGAIVDDADAHA